MSEKKSLAQFIVEKREKKGLSAQGLAIKAAIPLKDIEDIESGQVLFLPSTIRQKLANSLKITNAEIKFYEKNFNVTVEITDKYIEELKSMIISGETQNLTCPNCRAKLICKVEQMYDLDDNLVLMAKAHCEKCSFIIK